MTRLRIASALGIGQELEVLRAERDGIIIGDRALIGEAADVVEIELRRQGRWADPDCAAGRVKRAL